MSQTVVIDGRHVERRPPHEGDCGVFSVLCGGGGWILSLLLGWLLFLSGCNQTSSVVSGRVSGNSMEPNFAGERAYYRCRQCELESFFSPLPSPDKHLYCPRCHATVSVSRLEMGQLVQYERMTDATQLRIGDAIVFDPQKIPGGSELSGLQIKRVAALPGQTLSIKNGDLWIDGWRQQADCKQFSERAVLVDSSEFQTEVSRMVDDWIVYWPSSLYPRQGASFMRHASWLLDESPWDIHESREFVRVDDFGIELEFVREISASVALDIELRMQSSNREIDTHISRISPKEVHVECTVRQSEQQSSQSFDLKCQAIGRIGVAIVDGNLRVRIGDTEGSVPILESSSVIEQAEPSTPENKTQLGFAKSNVLPQSNSKWIIAFKVRASEPIGYQAFLKRDLFYRGPHGELEYELPAVGGFQVLGDHVAASVDSRQEYPNGIPSSAIVGRINSVDCH